MYYLCIPHVVCIPQPVGHGGIKHFLPQVIFKIIVKKRFKLFERESK